MQLPGFDVASRWVRYAGDECEGVGGSEAEVVCAERESDGEWVR